VRARSCHEATLFHSHLVAVAALESGFCPDPTIWFGLQRQRLFGTFTKPNPENPTFQVRSAFPTNYGIVFQYAQQLADMPIYARSGFEIMLPSSSINTTELLTFILLPLKVSVDLNYEIAFSASDVIYAGVGAGYDAIFGLIPLGYTELHGVIGYARSITENLHLTLEAQPGYGFQNGAAIPIINFRAGLRFQFP
jgi:hypothetical protein